MVEKLQDGTYVMKRAKMNANVNRANLGENGTGGIGSRENENNAAFAKKRLKMGNLITIVDGIKFRSSKEAKKYHELKLLQDNGEIKDLRLQVGFELNEGGKFSFKYYADFCFWENDKYVVMDVKGFRTETYKRKKRLMKKVLGIDITEV